MSHLPDPVRHHPWRRVTLAQLHRLKQWRQHDKRANRLESEAWEAVLTLWMMGWIGWLPAFAFNAIWAYPLCLLAMQAPGLYVYWRARAHDTQRLRCDWLHLLG